jgi:phage gpG-like protein
MAGLTQALSFTQAADALRRGTLVPVLSVGAAAPAAPAAGQPVPIAPALGRVLVQILVADIKARFATGTAPDGTRWRPLKFNRPRGGNQPLRDTGRLMASITGEARAAEVVVGTAHPSAPLHQYGGVVRPVKGKFLAIPLSVEAVRAGSPRRVRGTEQMPLFARVIPATGERVGHFLLVKQVSVPARPFMGASDQAMAAISAAVLDEQARDWQAA